MAKQKKKKHTAKPSKVSRPPRPPKQQASKKHKTHKTQAITNINADNYIKPRKNTGMKVLRVVLWVMISFVFVRGIISSLRPDPVSEMQRQTAAFMREVRDSENQSFEIESFAQNFAREYLTYEPGGMDDYISRITPYISGHVTFSGISNFRNTASASYVNAYRMEPYSQDQYDVYVMAVIDYTARQYIEGASTVTAEQDSTYLKIPVRVHGQGRYIVEDHPVFIAPPDRSTHEYTQFYGPEADRDVNAEIERILGNFLPVYYQENQTRIDYFLAPEANREDFKGLDGRYRFARLNNTRSYSDPIGRGSFLSLVEITLEDRNGQQLIQRFNILIRRQEERYYIVGMDTKTVDLKHNFN